MDCLLVLVSTGFPKIYFFPFCYFYYNFNVVLLFLLLIAIVWASLLVIFLFFSVSNHRGRIFVLQKVEYKYYKLAEV